jgi:hypothetical protein
MWFTEFMKFAVFEWCGNFLHPHTHNVVLGQPRHATAACYRPLVRIPKVVSRLARLLGVILLFLGELLARQRAIHIAMIVSSSSSSSSRKHSNPLPAATPCPTIPRLLHRASTIVNASHYRCTLAGGVHTTMIGLSRSRNPCVSCNASTAISCVGSVTNAWPFILPFIT